MQECQSMQSLNVSQFFSVSTRLMAIGLVFFDTPYVIYSRIIVKERNDALATKGKALRWK